MQRVGDHDAEPIVSQRSGLVYGRTRPAVGRFIPSTSLSTSAEVVPANAPQAAAPIKLSVLIGAPIPRLQRVEPRG
jgi:hypothetical protein